MKSLQNQYNLIKEGKGSTKLFLHTAKNQFPNIVTNILTFEEAVVALHNKGVITETIFGAGVVSKPAVEPDWFKIFKENMQPDKKVVDMETAGYDYKDTKNPNNLAMGELLNGYYTELRDPNNADKTEEQLKEIVFKNLEKDPYFYIKNAQFGVKGIGYVDESPGLGKPVEATGKYKSSGMLSVKLNEGIHDRDITSASHTNVKGELGKYDPKERAASLARLKNMGPKPKDDEAKTKEFETNQDESLEETQDLVKMIIDAGLTDNYHAAQAILVALGAGAIGGTAALASKVNKLIQKFKAGKDQEEMQESKMISLVDLVEGKKPKKHSVDAHFNRIEKMSEVAAWENKISMVDEMISELKNKLTMTEADEVKDYVDKVKIKEIKKELSALEKRRQIYEKKCNRAKMVAEKVNKKMGYLDEGEDFDEEKADLNDDNKLSDYEEKKGKAMAANMDEGGQEVDTFTPMDDDAKWATLRKVMQAKKI